MKGGGRMNHLLNICNINGAEVEPVDVIIGGSPRRRSSCTFGASPFLISTIPWRDATKSENDL